MATSRATCIYDAFIGYNNTAQPNGTTDTGNPVSPGGSVFQFHLPVLQEINITSAKLYFWVVNTGKNTSIRAQLYDWFKTFEGANRATYDIMKNDYSIAWAEDEYATNSDAVGFNQYVAIDITELVIGYLGKQYYTLGLVAKRTSSASDYNYSRIGFIESGHPAYIELTYDYAIPFKPTLIYPVGEAISNQGNLTFQWNYNSSGTTGQKKFDLQWKMQAATSWNTVSQQTAATSYTMEASLLTNGIVEWRVRTYNLHNMVSEWSESQFVVIGKPANPTISGVLNDAITEITWNANKAEESAARVRIMKAGKVIYDSGIIPAGMQDSHKPDIMLDNGSYVALLSISNMYDMWSNEISYPFTIGNTRPSISKFDIIGLGDHVKVSCIGTEGAEYFIFRAEDEGEFIPIARVLGKGNSVEYEDYAVKADTRYRYFVRCYLRAYSDSGIRDVSTKYKGYLFSLVERMSRKVLFFFHEKEDRIPLEKKMVLDNSLIYYTGRKKPVKERGIKEDHTYGLSAYLSKEDMRILETLIAENGAFCLRCRDFVAFCDVTGFSSGIAFFGKGYSINLTLKEIDYTERVRFNE